MDRKDHTQTRCIPAPRPEPGGNSRGKEEGGGAWMPRPARRDGKPDLRRGERALNLERQADLFRWSNQVETTMVGRRGEPNDKKATVAVMRNGYRRGLSFEG